jgi:hypothetical protein
VGTVYDETGYAIITINIASGNSPESQRFNEKKAVIDTGATNSAIDKKLIKELGLAQMGAHDGRAFDRIIPDLPHYAGRIEIPELSWGWDLKTIHPTNGIPGFYDAVIGNDILGSCTLMVVGPAKRFTLIRGTPIGGEAVPESQLMLGSIVLTSSARTTFRFSGILSPRKRSSPR